MRMQGGWGNGAWGLGFFGVPVGVGTVAWYVDGGGHKVALVVLTPWCKQSEGGDAMGLEDAIDQLLFEMVNAAGSIVLDGVAGFFPAVTIAKLLVQGGLMEDKGGGRPTKRQVTAVRGVLKRMPRVVKRERSGVVYYRGPW